MKKTVAVQVLRRNAEKTRLFLSSHGFFLQGAKTKSSGDYVLFPINRKFDKKKFPELKGTSFSFTQDSFETTKKKSGDIKDFLQGKFSETEIDSVVKSFDLLGNAAIIEVPKELSKKEKMIAEALMHANHSVESVFKKTGAHSGVFRAEPVKLVAGKKTRFAYYRESGAVFRISLGEVFFSPRLSYERTRISKLIKDGEVVAGLFAGVGPFPIVFAKNSGMSKSYAIELNPKAFEDLVENVKDNKVSDRVFPVLADVNEFVPKFIVGKCDRAVMPLPKGAEDFLEAAILSIKPSGGIVHFYGFVGKEDPYSKSLAKIKEVAKKLTRKVKIRFKRKVRDYSPDTIQIVIDFEIRANA